MKSPKISAHSDNFYSPQKKCPLNIYREYVVSALLQGGGSGSFTKNAKAQKKTTFKLDKISQKNALKWKGSDIGVSKNQKE